MKPSDLKSAAASSKNLFGLLPLAYYQKLIAEHVDPKKRENQILFDTLEFAYQIHKNVWRKSREPFISHPVGVVKILAQEFNLQDPVFLASALLHDSVEDEPLLRIRDLESRFGKVVAELVDGCTKLSRQRLDRATLKDLTHSKIFLHASQRLGVILIKLADRLHNIRTLQFLNQAKRRRIAQETVDVYAPIAGKLNIFPLKRELNHGALCFLYPRKSKKILNAIGGLIDAPAVAEIKQNLQETLVSKAYSLNIRPRAKDLGAYYSPIKRTLDLGNAENRIDFTIVLDTLSPLDCYSVLGLATMNPMLIHVPNSIHDYIAMPKNNGYQSLHVRVKYKGTEYLLKIRTREMDQFANYGILHQWDMNRPLSDKYWLEISDLMRSLGEYGGTAPKRKDLIRLAGSEEIFVFTPKGDIHYFPRGSIVLDFAYKIHSNLGDNCESAFINGKWAPITQPLEEGDTVEIVTSAVLLEVNSDLEELCKTPKARTAVNRHRQKKLNIYAEKIGKEVMSQEIRKHGFTEKILEGETIALIQEIFNIKNLSQMFVRIGQDKLSPKAVLYYFDKPKLQHPEKTDQSDISPPLPDEERNFIVMEEIEKGIHKFSQCCKPYPGQEGVVAALSERGVAFHQANCPKFSDQDDFDQQKLLNVRWNTQFHWERPLEFDLCIVGESLSSIFPVMAQIPYSIRIHRLEDDGKDDVSIVRLELSLKNFRESQSFFKHFEEGSVIIEDYRRGKATSR
ncbi:HD domain-containing protein [Thermodesulfobacteriota bacterium]